jgi:hypothetical protein
MRSRIQWGDSDYYRPPESGESMEWAPESGEAFGELYFETEAEAPSEADQVAGAVQGGLYDENQITNRIFFQRHPEHAGRAIAPEERQLAAEWGNIRDRIVRPVLQKSGITPIDVRPYKALIPLLNRYRGNIPLEYLLGWIAVESGGNIKSYTSLDERGYFQFFPGESAALHVDHQRLSNDPEYSIEKGIELVKYRVAAAAKYGFAPGTELYWTVGKLMHWLPLGVQLTVALMRQKGFRPTTWDEFRRFMLDNRMTILTQLKAKPGSGWDPASGVNNVDTLLRKGRQIAQALGVQAGGNPQVSPEFEAQLFY